ncbi:MAG: hypothetical protein KKA05_11885 [Alphaproteobacteria bacterium]|nr:hypothetical protein [Alphaproteobacteria bacterium]
MSPAQKLMDGLTRRRMAFAKMNGLLFDAEHAAMHAISHEEDGSKASATAEMRRAESFTAAFDHIAMSELVDK